MATVDDFALPQLTFDEQVDDPATPAAGLARLFYKTDGKWYAIDDAGAVAQVATATGTPDGTKFLRDDGVWATPSGGGGSTTANSFSFDAGQLEVSRTGFGAPTSDSAYKYNMRRISSGSQNDEIVFRAPVTLNGGTWSLQLLHRKSLNRGIYTIEFSTDASTWSGGTTIDGYASSETGSVDVKTGVTIPSSAEYVRLKMATKNASSTAYYGTFSGLSGFRTGA